ncbi:MAG: zf-HC2 domain-containing protein [Anaerolineae bacterium]|nr:zf-HC2 domain-containing protein [Anaerolineae bacterium]
MIEEHVTTDLIAYLDGELIAAERGRVESHLARCAECRNELAELRALQQGLGATLDAALAPVHLSREADAQIRGRLRSRLSRSPWWRAIWLRRGLVTQAMLAIMVLFASFASYQTLSLPAAAPLETIVLGQDHFAPGSEAALRVIVRSGATSTLAGVEVAVNLVQAARARQVYQGVTDASGTAQVTFAVPDNLAGEAELVVETRAASAGAKSVSGRVVHPITIARAYKIYLMPDKPAYRPGQSLHLRALVLDALTLSPAAGIDVVLEVSDPRGKVLASSLIHTSDFGVASLSTSLPEFALLGTYTLRAALGDTVSERAVTVDTYRLPAFRVEIVPSQTFYTPGARVEGVVEAAYFFGKPVTGASVTLRGYVDRETGKPAVMLTGRTDDQGCFNFVFEAPIMLSGLTNDTPMLMDIEAQVVDSAGQETGARYQLPVAAQQLLIKAVPESGDLKPGVENVIYIHTSLPDGTPVASKLTITVGTEQAEVVSSFHSLAEFRFVPPVSTAASPPLLVQARDAEGHTGEASFTFASDGAPQVLLLRSERAVYRVGETLRLEALVSGAAEQVYLDVVRARQMVEAFSAPVVDGRAIFALDLDATLVGSLELRAYTLLPEGEVIEDTRLVVVDAPDHVNVDIVADQETYRPGETAQVEVQTTLAGGGQPVQTALGISVVDASVYALDTLPPGFARAYFLLEQAMLDQQGAMGGVDVPTLLGVKSEVQAAQDVAARAAWATASATKYSLQASAVMEAAGKTARVILAQRVGWMLVLLPLLLGLAVARGLAPTGMLGRALRRLGWGALGATVLSPLLIAGGALGMLLPLLGASAALLFTCMVVGLWGSVWVYGWRRRDTRVQVTTGLLGAYLALLGWTVGLATKGGEPRGLLLVLIVGAFLFLVAALVLLGQGLVLEGRRMGWVLTVLAILLILLAVTLPAVPALRSQFTQTLGTPALYAGPAGWLVGCGGATPELPRTEEPAQEATAAEVEKEVEAEMTKEVGTMVIPTPAPTASLSAGGQSPTVPPAALSTPAPQPTSTPQPTTAPAVVTADIPVGIPSEPYPLRHIFPETLYWSPEALTDEAGWLAFDLPLADTFTTWQLTALASTLEGDLGAATYNLVVFQDFFVALSVPETVQSGTAVTATATLYNYLPEMQTVTLDLEPAAWYTVLDAPGAVTLAAESVASVDFLIRPEQAGMFTLHLNAGGPQTSDAVSVPLQVE